MSGRVGALSRTSTKVLFSTFAVAAFLAVAAFVSGAVSAQQTMVASWYGPGFEGATTASGEPFDPYGYTAAHKELAFGTKLIVTYNGASVVVVINDRGPFIEGRDLDLSQGAAEAIGLTAAGEGVVGIEYADASVPVGPYSGAAPVAQPTVEQPTVEQPIQQTQTVTGDDGAVVTQYSNAGDGAVDDQYGDSAADDQYGGVDDDQYDNAGGGAAVDQYVPDVAVQNSVPVSPVPAAGAVIEPPADLAVPGSTVEKRIELAIAAPPVGYVAPVAVEEESSEIETVYGPSSEPSLDSGLTALPDTGGVPLVPVAAIAATLVLGAALGGTKLVLSRR